MPDTVRERKRGMRAAATTHDPSARRRSWLVRGVVAFGLERGARLVAVAVVPLLLAVQDEPDRVLFAVLATYVLLTALLPRNRLLQVADLLASAALVLWTGVDVAPYLPFVLVAVAGPAAREGMWAGLAAGGVLGSILAVTVAFEGGWAILGIAAATATILLPPLAGVTAAAASEALNDRELRERRILQEANRLLSSLQAIADEVPGGLDVSTVASKVMTEVRSHTGVQAALLLCDNGSGHLQAGRTGRVLDVHGHVPEEALDGLLARDRSTVSARDLPPPLTEACAQVPVWVVLPMGTAERTSAVLLVGFDDPSLAHERHPELVPLAEDASLALENARLFDGTRSRAVDAARRQLAADLHDGVAQSLAHLRMELELLALRDDASRPEAERLAKVADAALLDLRRTISGLRLAREDALAARLERHLRQVRTPHGPRLDLIVLDDPPLDATTTEELFRVAQEAVSNAVRHADASEITVVLDHRDGDLLLRIEDDGVGLDPVRPGQGSGVGLASMRERASRLQADLRIDAGERGGTRILLRVPTGRRVVARTTPDPGSGPPAGPRR